MNKLENYYISTGDKTMMYTLRCQWEEIVSIGGDLVNLQRDSYIRNLSIDAKKAKEKANEMGYIVSKPTFDLAEIRRNEDARVRLVREEREIAEENERIAKEERLISFIKDGLYPFGKYVGKKFDVADMGYISYWLNSDPQDSVTKSLVSVLTIKFPKIVELLKLKGNTKYFGDIKTRYQKLKGTVIDRFAFENQWGWQSVVRIVLSTGELATYIGAGNLELVTGTDAEGYPIYNYPEKGDVITFAATVKCHGTYLDENFTSIQRIKLKEIIDFEV